MLATNFYDLEQLSLTIRDPNTRIYIEEAIRAYQAGAYRTAVIGNWAAVVYDIIQKIRELDNAGEGAARVFVEKLDKAINQNDTGTLLKIEDGLIEKAQQEYEMIQPHEAVALLRLKQDRHLCAHPAIVTNDILFQPTPEAVHTHIVHSVIYLLQHQPMQGKSALERMYKDIAAPSFPADIESASKYLSERYLRYAKSSLLRNWIITLIKRLLKEEETVSEKSYIVALKATFIAKQSECESILKEQLPLLASQGISDDRLLNIFVFTDMDRQSWGWLDAATKIKLREIIKSGTLSDRYTSQVLSGIMEIEELAELMTSWFAFTQDPDPMMYWQSLEKKISIIELKPLPKLIPIAMSMYADAPNYKTANRIGNKIILPLIECMSFTDIKKLLDTVYKNRQVREASETPDLLCRAFDKTILALPGIKEVWQDFITLIHSEAIDKSSYYAYPTLSEKISKVS